MDWLEHVRDAKPSTLREHRLLLQEPGLPHKRGSGVTKGLIMKVFGDLPAEEVTTRDVNALLLQVAKTGVSPRTINKTRQLVCAIYNYGCREATFALPKNPATEADRRPEPERPRLDFFSVEEIEALARSLADGRHRDPRLPAITQGEKHLRAAEDRQDGELVRVAAYSGLRRGELVTLRWRDVDFARHKIVVSRTMSADVESTTTKSRKVRDVPLPDQAAGALDRLSQRSDFTGPEDYVFANRLGRRLDASALRRRVDRARDAVGLRPLRFHDLGTRMDRCSWPAEWTSLRSSPRWVTRGSPLPSGTSTRGLRATWLSASPALSSRSGKIHRCLSPARRRRTSFRAQPRPRLRRRSRAQQIATSSVPLPGQPRSRTAVDRPRHSSIG